MITWALTHIPQLIFFFVLFSVVRAAVRAAKLSQEHQAGTSETDEQRRVREIQERIRKKIAERRGGMAPAAEAQRVPTPPIMRPTVAPLDPFGGPATPRRVYREIERRIVTPVAPPQNEGAILERQEQLAAQMRGLEEARTLAVRRAANVVESNAASTRTAAVAAQRAGWLADLRDPQSLRRAFVLREVLGAPVALR